MLRTAQVRRYEPLGSKLNRRIRRKFEQKAAKETKTDWVSVLFIGRAFGDSPVLQLSSSSLEPLRSKLNRMNGRKFEQKVAKETKCKGTYPFGASANVRSLAVRQLGRAPPDCVRRLR